MYKVLYYYTKKYWYYGYFRISCDFGEELDHFTSKFHILKTIGNILCPFDYTAVAGSGKVGPVNQVNHTSWVAVVTPTDRPKSVRNRCVIELFVALCCHFALLTFLLV